MDIGGRWWNVMDERCIALIDGLAGLFIYTVCGSKHHFY